MSADCDASSTPVDAPPAAFLQWALILAVGVTVLSLAAANAPPRVRLLGLFLLAYGLIAGTAARLLAERLALSGGRRLAVVTAAVIAVGAAGVVLESWRQYRAKLQDAYARELRLPPSPRPFVPPEPRPKSSQTPGQDLASTGRRQLADAVQSMQDKRAIRNAYLEEVAARQQRDFAAKGGLPVYLRRRLKALGDWPSPSPELFVIAEILLAAVAGGWQARMAPRDSGNATAV